MQAGPRPAPAGIEWQNGERPGLSRIGIQRI